jgi:hypothetical protein
MRLVTLRGITASAILSMALIQGAYAANNTGATLIRPSQDAKVEMMSEVTGKVLMRGWPMVLVRADLPDCLWWAQQWAEPTAAAGYFKAKVRFGNDKSKDGSRFRLVVVMAKSEEDAKRFQPGSSFKDLPEELPRSAETVVVLKRWRFESEAIADVIKSPALNSQVGRMATVVGKGEKDSQPVVLVRSAESNSQWWVQSEPRISEDGSFSTTARFGNPETPAGTRFKLLVIFPTKTQARAYMPAEPIQQLPKDISHSAEVEVIRIDSAEGPQSISTTTPDS